MPYFLRFHGLLAAGMYEPSCQPLVAVALDQAVLALLHAGHTGDMSGIIVQVHERDTRKNTRGELVRHMSLEAWALDLCLKMPEGRWARARG